MVGRLILFTRGRVTIAGRCADGFCCFVKWANPRGNAIRGRPVDGVEQAHSTRPEGKNTGNFIGLSLETVAEITLQRTDTTHDLSSESREAITTDTARPGLPQINKHQRQTLICAIIQIGTTRIQQVALLL